jgi:hypothetical protein
MHLSLETANQKKAHPAYAPFAALRVRGADGIFGRGIHAAAENDVHPCTSPLRGFVRRLRRCGRGPAKSKAKSNSKIASNGNGNGNGKINSEVVALGSSSGKPRSGRKMTMQVSARLE